MTPAARRKNLTPWQRIMRATNRGTGLRLSADEIGQLSSDGAIETRAELDDEEREAESVTPAARKE